MFCPVTFCLSLKILIFAFDNSLLAGAWPVSSLDVMGI